MKAGGVSHAMVTCSRCTVSVTVARRCEVIGGVTAVTGSTVGPAGIGPNHFVSSARSVPGSKSPAMAIDALLGV